jgi:hypothetical protein
VVGEPLLAVLGPRADTLTQIVGWGFYLLILAVGLASVVATSVAGYRYFRDRGYSGVALQAYAVGVAIAAFLGLWLIMDAYWLVRFLVRLARGTSRQSRPFKL